MFKDTPPRLALVSPDGVCDARHVRLLLEAPLGDAGRLAGGAGHLAAGAALLHPGVDAEAAELVAALGPHGAHRHLQTHGAAQRRHQALALPRHLHHGAHAQASQLLV